MSFFLRTAARALVACALVTAVMVVLCLMVEWLS